MADESNTDTAAPQVGDASGAVPPPADPIAAALGRLADGMVQLADNQAAMTALLKGNPTAAPAVAAEPAAPEPPPEAPAPVAPPEAPPEDKIAAVEATLTRWAPMVEEMLTVAAEHVANSSSLGALLRTIGKAVGTL
jgi:hypothetical protein